MPYLTQSYPQTCTVLLSRLPKTGSSVYTPYGTLPEGQDEVTYPQYLWNQMFPSHMVPIPPSCPGSPTSGGGSGGGGNPWEAPPVSVPNVPSEGEDIPSADDPIDDPVQDPGTGPYDLPPGPIPLPDPITTPEQSEGGGQYSDFPFASLNPWDWPGAGESSAGSGQASSVPGGQETMSPNGTGAIFLADVVPIDDGPLGQSALGNSVLSPAG